MADFQGVIFDFNGVLLWDSPLHEQAWQIAARELRGREIEGWEFAEHVHGRTNATIFSYLMGREAVGSELARLVDFKESIYRRLCLRSPDVFVLSPGAEELLTALARHGIPRTIATSSEKTNLDFFVHSLGLGRWFEVEKIVHDDGTLPGKPAPDAFLRAAKNIGVAPAQCVVVEDSLSGLEAARAAGLGCIVALAPRAGHAALRSQRGVFTVIEDLGQFPKETLVPRSDRF